MPDGLGGEQAPRAVAQPLGVGSGSDSFPGSALPGILVVPARGGAQIAPDEIFRGGLPIGGLSSTFNIFGAPIAILGGVFGNGLPLGGPVTQIFRGGSGPQPNTLFISTISSAGPIGSFFLGSSGAPIGLEVFLGGGLPIGLAGAAVGAVEAIQPRTALVALPTAAFGVGGGGAGAPPIGM